MLPKDFPYARSIDVPFFLMKDWTIEEKDWTIEENAVLHPDLLLRHRKVATLNSLLDLGVSKKKSGFSWDAF